MTGDIRDPVASLTQRLRNKAVAVGVPFQVMLEHYAIFRFLYQLAASPYRDTFILKGGLAFLGWGLDLRRPTRDIDLQSYTESSAENLSTLVKDICAPSANRDPLVFDLKTVIAAPIMLQAEHSGVRIKLTARLDNIQIPMQIDFSFANVITPGPILMEYPDPLGTERTRIQGYPPETAISEKLEAIAKWGTLNARLKDYFDIWLLSRECAFDGPVLAQAIKATFANRGTPIPTNLPPSLTQEFAEQQQKQWSAFLGKFDAGSEDKNEPFAKNWPPESNWT